MFHILSFKGTFAYFIYVCMPECTYMHHVHAGFHRGQEMLLDSLEPELHVAVN